MQMANRIFKNTIALTIASAGQMLGNLVLYYYLLRLLQAEGLGIYSTVIAVFHTVALGVAVVNPYIPRELPKDLSQTNRYLIHGGLVSLATALALMAGLAALTPFLGYLPETQTSLYIISLALIPEALDVVIFSIFVAHQKAKFITAASVVVILGRIVVSLLALRLGFGVIGLVVVYAAFNYLALGVGYFFLTRSILKPRWEFDPLFLRKMLGELKYFAALTLLSAVFSQSEVIVLSLLAGETQVGFYTAGQKLVTIWEMAPRSYVTAVFPVLSAAYVTARPRAIELQNRSLKYLLALALPLAVGLTVTSGTIIPLFFGPGFEESITVLRITAWYLPLSFVSHVLWRVLMVRNEQRLVFRVQLANEIVQVATALALIPRYGGVGAAWALLAGNLTYTLLSILLVRRDKTPLPLARLGWRFAVAAAVMGAVAWALLAWLHVFAVAPLAAGVYALALWLLRAFSAEDIAALRRLLGAKSAQAVPLTGALNAGEGEPRRGG